MGVNIRLAAGVDFARIESIECRADELLIEYLGAINWPPATRAEERAEAPGFTLLATDADTGEAVGFTQVLESHEGAHLEQISVLPERGHKVMTLRTFADVPWNAPFYAKHQFAESAPTSVFQRALIGTEERLGLTAYGRRVQMSRGL